MVLIPDCLNFPHNKPSRLRSKAAITQSAAPVGCFMDDYPAAVLGSSS
jgi:hypothetical protein